jgi:hypothetical protein
MCVGVSSAPVVTIANGDDYRMFDCHAHSKSSTASPSATAALSAWWQADDRHPMTSWLSYSFCLPHASHMVYITSLGFNHTVCSKPLQTQTQDTCHSVYSTKLIICESPAICLQQIAATKCITGQKQLQFPFLPRDAQFSHSTVVHLIEDNTGISLYSVCSPRQTSII